MTTFPDAGPVDAAGVVRRAVQVRERISASGGDPERVTIVAVTKSFGVDVVRAAGAAGISDLGENYPSELLAKAAELASGPSEQPRWHYLGSIQRKRVARLAPYVALWQGVDRIEEGEAIARHAPGASVLVEVEVSGLPGRGGVAPVEVASLVERLSALGLVVRGLMTVAPPIADNPVETSRVFAIVRHLVTELGLAEASMGMSDDLELAVAEGATMVRVGRALFGSRLQAPKWHNGVLAGGS